MKCNYCGADNKEESKFCASCGAELKEKKKTTKKEEAEVKEEKIETKPYVKPEVVKPEEKDGKGTASLVLGIISMLVWCVTPITSIIGLILGICAKKSGKKVAGIILNAIALTISVVCLLFCMWFGAVINAAIERVGDSGEFERFFEIIEEEYEKAEKEVEKEENEIETPTETEETKVEEGKMIIGDDTYGYVQVPSDWKEFKDIDGNSSIQYTDIGDMGYIISLNIVDGDVSPYTAATNIKNHIITENADAKVVYTKISKYYGYKVEAKYPDGTYLDAYLFKTDDGKLHYISIEGPDKDNDSFKIPDTFSVNK